MSIETIEEGFRLSPQQKRLWTLQSSLQAHNPYLAQCLIHLRGTTFDYDKVYDTLQQIVQQHEIFHTCFRRLTGMKVPLQVIQEDNSLSLRFYDWKEQAPEYIPEMIANTFRDMSKHVFDFEYGSLMQTVLIELSPEVHVLLVSLPALCADYDTLKLIAREIARITEATNNSVISEDDVMQYADIAEWQNELIVHEDAEVECKYWQQKDGAIFANWHLPLPFEQKDVPGSFVPVEITSTVPSALIAKIEHYADSHGSSLAAFLLTCWEVLLWRYSQQEQMLIGVAHRGRKYGGLEDAIGLLAKYLPFYDSFEADTPFAEMLTRTAERVEQDEQWEEYFSWDHLLEQQEEGAETLFFPLTFAYNEQPAALSTSKGSVSLERCQVYWDRFNIQLSCNHSETEVSLAFQFNAVLYTQEDIQRLADAYMVLLKDAADHPEVPVDRLEILTETMKRQILVDFSAVETMTIQEQAIHTLFEAQAARTPDKVALVFEDQHITFDVLNACANRVARQLQTRGVGLEAVVVVCLERSPAMLVAMLAVLKAGGAYVPWVPALPLQQLAYILDDTQAKLLLTQQRVAEQLAEQRCDVMVLEHYDKEEIAGGQQENLACQTQANNLAYVLYTSGSTGRPKGVSIEHGRLLNYVYGIRKQLDLPDDFSFATVSTFAADLGNTAIYSALCWGGCLHVISEDCAITPGTFAEYMQTRSIDCLKIVPLHLSALAADQQGVFPRKRLVLGGEAASWQLIQKVRIDAPDCTIFNHYGPTETTVGVMTYCIETPEVIPPTSTVPIGKPLPNTQVYLLDAHMQPVLPWMPGEVHIGGDNLARGYQRNPEMTAQRFVPGPSGSIAGDRLYKTGDLAYYLPDGNIVFLGRTDQQVKIRGYRVEVEGVETLLTRHAAIQTCAVIAREDSSGGMQLVAFVVPEPGQTPSSEQLRKFLAEQLAEPTIPSRFVFLEKLPLSANGKIDRRILNKVDIEGEQERTGEIIPPCDAIELHLLHIWEDLLQRRDISVTDNFFDLGGHSLLAVRLMTYIQRDFQRILPLSLLFEGATIEYLAKVLREETDTLPWSPLVCLQPQGEKQPFYCVHAGGGNILGYIRLARLLGTAHPFYGLQSPGLSVGQEPCSTIEEMAKRYINEIRRVHPEGPYWLGAWCMGTMIAYEMALQLQAQKQQVHLILIDGWSPSLATEEVDPAQRLTDDVLAFRFARHLALPLAYNDFRNCGRAEQLQQILEQVQLTHMMPAEAGVEQLERLLDVYKANVQAAENYSITDLYAGRITLFRACDTHHPDPTMGWDKLATEGVEVEVLPGNHHSMLKEPNVHELAEHLRTCLEKEC